MNNLFKKIATAFVGMAMAIGVGVAVSQNPAIQTKAATTAFSWTRSGTEDTVTSGYEMVLTNYKTNTSNYYQDKSSTVGLDVGVKISDGTIWTTAPTSATLTVSVGGGSTRDPLTNNVLAYFLDSNGDTISGSETVVTTKVETTTGKEYTIAMPSTNNVAGVLIHHDKESSYNVRLYSMSLSYASAGEATVSSVAISGEMTKTTYTSLESWDNSGLSANVTMSDESSFSGTTTWEYDPSSPALLSETTSGSVNVTATANGVKSDAKSVSNITVSLANVAQGIEATPSTGNLTGVAVKGTVSGIDGAVSSGSLKYYISDDGTTDSDQIYIFYGKYVDKANFNDTPQINVGDEVVVFGNLTIYNSAVQFASGSYLLSHVQKTPSVTIDVSSVTIDIEDDPITLTATTVNGGGNNVVWSSSATDVATIDSSTGKLTPVALGQTKITATLTVNNVTYKDEITVTVTGPVVEIGEYVAIFSGEAYLVGFSETTTIYGLSGEEDNALVFEIVKGNQDDTFAFLNNGSYIAWKSGNSLTTESSITDNSSWTIVGSAKDNLTITNVADSTRVLKYNSSANPTRFACYASTTGNNVCLVAKEKPVDPTVNVTSVTLDKQTLELYVGNDATLVATVLPENATDLSLTWSLKDENDANYISVDQKGKVNGLAEGTGTVVASSVSNPDVKAECIVTVIPAPTPSSLEVSYAGGDILQGGKLKASDITAKVIYTDKSEVDVKIDDLDIYTLDANDAHQAFDFNAALEDLGEIKLYFDYKVDEQNVLTGSIKFSVVEAPVAVTGVSLDNNEVTVEEEKTITLVATVVPSNATDKSVTWTSDDETVATVKDGVVTGVKAGTAKITVKTTDGEFTASCTVTVTPKPVIWSDVTSSLAVGDVVAIVNKSASAQLKEVTTKNIGDVNEYEANPSTTYLFTVEAGSAANSFAFRKGDNYLAYSANKALSTQTNIDDKSSWTVSFDKDGNAVIASVGSTAGTLQYNSSSPRFCVYESSQTAIQLIKYHGEYPNPKTVYYEVTFNSDGGSAVDSQSVKENTAASKPANPTKEGYTFLGWYLNDTEYKFSTPVTANITLVAKWQQIVKYTVTFNSNGGSSVASQSVEAGKTVTAPTAPTKEGYTFDGWYSDEALTKAFDFKTVIDADITLYAKWTENTTPTPTPTPTDGVKKTIDDLAATYSWASGTKYDSFKFDDVISVDIEGGSNSGKYYTVENAASQLRLYQTESPKFTLSAASGYTIDSLKLTFVVDKTGTLLDEGGNVVESDASVIVNKSSVSFTVGNSKADVTNGQVRLTAIEIVYHQGESADITPTGIALNQTTASLQVGNTVTLAATLAPAGAKGTITWSSSDASVATVENGVVTGVKAGSATITAACGDLKATCVVTVSDMQSLTVAQALTIAKGLDDGATTNEEYKVSGVVVEIKDAYNAQFGNITFTMADSSDGETLTVYRLKVTEAEAATIKVGAEIVVQGKLQNYVKDEVHTYELASGGKLISATGGEDPTPTPTPTPSDKTVVDVDFVLGNSVINKGDSLDVTITVYYSDNTSETINLSEATVTGFDASKTGNQTVTISYGDKTTTVKVLVVDKLGCAGSAVAGSAIISLTTLLGAGLLMLKKKKIK